MGALVILCLLSRSFWSLAGRGVEGVPGISLRVGALMSGPPAMHMDAHGKFRHLYVTEFEDIIAFPVLKWRGCRIYPEHWKSDASLPILRVRLMPWDANALSIFGTEHLAPEDHRKRMVALGWTLDPREGATAWLHVDELEKSEGPIPQGVF